MLVVEVFCTCDLIVIESVVVDDVIVFAVCAASKAQSSVPCQVIKDWLSG